MKEKVILVVSFGTSYPETCRKTIEKMEQAAAEKFPEYEVCRAWTSTIIRKKIEKRDGIHIPSVGEVMETLHQKGVKEVVVQPTHLLNGIENEIMNQGLEMYRPFYESVKIGKPLLTTQEDCEKLVDAMIQEFHPAEDEMVVLMGHGTEHHADFVYAAINYRFRMKGQERFAIGTVEGYPTVEDVLKMVEKVAPKKVILAPFMLVAGDHATNDLAGEEDSWKCFFEEEGYQVSCVIRGLGEYEQTEQLFLEHLKAAVEG